jgi:HD-like signal output (HDOD) protein
MTADAAAILLARHEQLPPRAAAAARVLALADDPDAGAQDLARAIATDPLFAARVLRVANSTYYGLSGRVSTLPFGVSVIGFQAVRSLAVVAAAGLDDPDGAPPGFWRAAALSATGAELVAPLIGADPGDAFCVGLLHLIGAALLHQHQPMTGVCLPLAADEAASEDELARERDQYGISHDQIGARVLAAWHFPEHVSGLIGRHHEVVLPQAEPLHRALSVARVLAGSLLLEAPLTTVECANLAWLTQGRLVEVDLPGVLERMADRSAALLDGLVPRR